MPPRVLKAANVLVADPAAEAAAREEAHRAEVAAAYRAGLAEGRALAEREGLAAVPRLVAALREAVDRIDVAAAASRAAAARAVAEAAVELACWIVRREIAHDPSLLAARVAEAMAHLQPAGRVVVRVAPGLVEPVAAWAEEAGVPASIEPDPSLVPGEARVIGDDCGADLTLATAVARAREALEAEG